MRSDDYPFVAASKRVGCAFELVKMMPRGDDRFAEYFNVTDADPARIVEVAEGYDSVAVTLLSEHERGGVFEFEVSGDCPGYTLARLGALPREIRSADGEGRIVAEIPPQHESAEVLDAFCEHHSDAELVAKRSRDALRPMFSDSAIERSLRGQLTERQEEVLRIAYREGYYEWPRESTGEEIAGVLDISPATFSEHVQAAERNLLTAMFDGT